MKDLICRISNTYTHTHTHYDQDCNNNKNQMSVNLKECEFNCMRQEHLNLFRHHSPLYRDINGTKAVSFGLISFLHVNVKTKTKIHAVFAQTVFSLI